jgi:predicted RNA binding protein YcfA (HicA-like mRNA interferase family)
VPFLH